MVALTGSEGLARLLSFLFYLVAARILAPEGFGVVRFTIALVGIAFGPMQVLAVVTGRELGAARGDPRRTGEVLGTTMAVAQGLLGLSLGACVLAAALGLTGSADLVGILVVLVGRALFELYYAVGRGTGQVGRMAVTYVGGSLAQLLALLALDFAGAAGATVALVVFGASSAVPLVLCEAVRPVIRGRALRRSRSVGRDLWRLGAPLILAEVAFLAWFSADQLWVEATLGTREVGLYAAAKTVAQIPAVLPAGAAGIMLPRMAELRAAGARHAATRLLWETAIGLLVLLLLVAAALGVISRPLMRGLFGAGYAPASASLIPLCVAAAVFGAFITLTNGAVGWGRPQLYTAGVAVAGASELLLLVLVAGNRASDAGWAYAGSITLGLVTVVVLLWRSPLRVARAHERAASPPARSGPAPAGAPRAVRRRRPRG